jgi:hypothetical protein
MTVFVYVNTSKQVGDPEHVKVFATGRRGKMVWGKRSRRRGVRVWGSGVNRIGRRTAYAMLVILVLAIVWQVLGSI